MTSAHEPFCRRMDIFPLIDQHAHGSTVVELPNGDLLAAWFQGSGERWADDVAILGARLQQGEDRWGKPFVMADVPEFPDINPVLFLDTQERLWLVWYTVIANQWETSLLKYRISDDYMQPEGPPHWCWQEVLHTKPGDRAERGIQPGDSFVQSVEEQVQVYARYLSEEMSASQEDLDRWQAWGARMLVGARGENMVRKGFLYGEQGEQAEQEMGYAYFRRMGWQTKNKAIIVDGKRIVLPLYSDGFDFSLMAITDDDGETWQFSEPLVGAGNIQPSIAVKSDGTLVTYMRDNGPPPKRMHVSSSQDQGLTWSPVRDSELPNPGAGADLVTLQNGHWVFAYNDTERGRHSLAISISTSEGQSWDHTRHLEQDMRDESLATGYAYPSIIAGQDGTLHVVYSLHRRDCGGGPNKTIRYAQFSEAWVMQAEPLA